MTAMSRRLDVPRATPLRACLPPIPLSLPDRLAAILARSKRHGEAFETVIALVEAELDARDHLKRTAQGA
jgi:hypothetical protein